MPFLLFQARWREMAQFAYNMVKSSSQPFGTAQTAAVLWLLWWLGISGTDSKTQRVEKQQGSIHRKRPPACTRSQQALSVSPITMHPVITFGPSFLTLSHCPPWWALSLCPSSLRSVDLTSPASAGHRGGSQSCSLPRVRPATE